MEEMKTMKTKTELKGQKLKFYPDERYHTIEEIALNSGLSIATVKKYAAIKEQPVRNGKYLWTRREAHSFLYWLKASTWPRKEPVRTI
jgi:hypothetical protein